MDINCALTLTDVRSQICDKVLTRPTFFEMYATLYWTCCLLPEFVEEDESITFRWILLDKCQEVFEHGETAAEKADKEEQDHETQIDPKERVLKCPNSRRCICWGKYVLSGSSTRRACWQNICASNHLTQWVRFHPQKQPYAFKHWTDTGPNQTQKSLVDT